MIPQLFTGRTSVPTCLLYTTIIRWPNIVCLPVSYNTTVIDWPNIVCLPVCCNTKVLHWPNRVYIPVCCISNHIRFFQNGVVYRCHFVGKVKQRLPGLKRKNPVNYRLCLKGEAWNRKDIYLPSLKKNDEVNYPSCLK